MSYYKGILSHNFPNQKWCTMISKNNFNIDYKKLGGQFCSKYYSIHTNNYFNASYFFDNACKITYNGYECYGYNMLLNKYKDLNITCFEYDLTEADCQPLKNELLINVIGKIRANQNNDIIYNFSETFIINCYYKISNYVFRIL